jgi:hypothetical protein
MSIFKEESGKTSSRRIAGLASTGIALAMALIDQFTSFKVDYSIWVAIYSAGMGLLGLTTINFKSQGTVPPGSPPGKPPDQ